METKQVIIIINIIIISFICIPSSSPPCNTTPYEMEFFTKSPAVRLKTHLDKYLVADDDHLTVRQSHTASATRRARWSIEPVDSNHHVLRLKSCFGKYLTASTSGTKVLQSLPENARDLAIEWQPVRDGFQVKLKTSFGTYLRAAGGARVPWRKSVTHEGRGCTDDGVLFDVEAVEVPEDEDFVEYLEMVTTFSSVSGDISGLEFGSPASIHSSSFSPRTPVLSINKRREPPSSAMEFFHHAKAVRLKNHHHKYLCADEDQESVTQDRNGASKNNRWTVEFVTGAPNDDVSIIRLKSCYNKYLTASNQPFLLGMTGRKVLQTVPDRLDSSVEWEPVRDGNQVKLRTRYGQYLRANGGLPPWRNSVTHDIPHRTATQEWILWDVDVVDIVVPSPAPRPPPPLVLHSDSFTSTESNSPATNWSKSPTFHENSDGSPVVKVEGGRAIYYHVVSDDFGEMDENAQGFCIQFKGNDVKELTRKLEEETSLKNITVCTRNPVNGNLYPLVLQLPPNNVTMRVVVVQNSGAEDE